MNKIIALPGTADAIFFINEVDYITKYFDEVVVISYPGNKELFTEIAKEKGFRLYVVSVNLLKALININFYKWLFDKNTKKELKSAFSLSKKCLLKVVYIFYYGLFFIEAKKYIDMELKGNMDHNIYLYSYWLTRGAYTIANYNMDRLSNVKKILSRAHGYDLYEERNQVNYLPFRDFINTNLDEIHFISEHGLDYFTYKYNCSSFSSKKYISRLGTFNPNKIRKKIYKKNKVCIASCSSIIPVKRLDLIIDVIANSNFPVEWIHIGTGIKEEKIKSYAAEKLKDIEYLFLGQIDNSKILETYEKYDVDFFINMSDSEGVPVSIMEAMSMGIPVIARNVGGVSEIVSRDVGLLIENIDNMKPVFSLINEEVERRLYDIETYENKHEACIIVWDKMFNADKTYNDFFVSIKKTIGLPEIGRH